MQFNSYQFLFVFVPLLLAGFYVATRLRGPSAARAWLLLASIAFYAYANLLSLVILLPAILIYFAIAKAIVRTDESNTRARTAWFILGVALNIAFLGYFKYRNFFLDSANQLFGAQFALLPLILPLGISFITFQMIAFLADVQSGQVKSFSLFEFLLFALFFPRAVAGPIVHWEEVMPGLTGEAPRWRNSNLAVGIALFSIGLFKKAVIADGVAVWVTPAFAAQPPGSTLTLIPAWVGALAYTFQLYFDFSGYTDMALGLARLFGVRLPMNFNSPLKSSSIVEFWSRWHITLTRFLTAYLYTPMVMGWTRRRMQLNRPVLRGKRSTLSAFLALTAVPTLITMGISGFWHGAGTQFIVWGLLHGLMLTINQAWRTWRPRFWPDQESYHRVMRPAGFLLTFFGIATTFVFFRARSIDSAVSILGSMFGAHGVTIPHAIGDRLGAFGLWLQGLGVAYDWSSGSGFFIEIAWVVVLFVASTRLPNSLELTRRYEPALDFEPPAETEPTTAAAPASPRRARRTWIPREIALNGAGAAWLAFLFIAGVLALSRGGGFLYWKF